MMRICIEMPPPTPRHARIDRRTLLAAAAILPLQPALAFAQQREGLVLAFIPQENPEKLMTDAEVISAWLADELGVPVRGFVTADHAAAVEALRNGSADISFMGALPYVLANRHVGATILLAEVYRGMASYTGRIFVRADSGIEQLADLRGRSIAFADPISESGYLYPLDTFVEAGLLERGEEPRRFFNRVFFAGGYQQAIQAVVAGLVDAAGVSQYADLLLSPAQQAEVRWIAESRPIPSHTVIARQDLDPELSARFVAAMLKLNDPENSYLLQHVYGPDGYELPDPAAYEEVAELAVAYGLLR
jgi:phosphonate transport system substrate-binding protein